MNPIMPSGMVALPLMTVLLIDLFTLFFNALFNALFLILSAEQQQLVLPVNTDPDELEVSVPELELEPPNKLSMSDSPSERRPPELELSPELELELELESPNKLSNKLESQPPLEEPEELEPEELELDEEEEEPPKSPLRRLESQPPDELEEDPEELDEDELVPLRKVSSNSESKPPDFVSDLNNSLPTSTPMLSNELKRPEVEFPPKSSLSKSESEEPENNPAKKFQIHLKIDCTIPLFFNVLNKDSQSMLEKILDTKLSVYWIKDWLPVMDRMISLTKSEEVISLTMLKIVLIKALFSTP